MQKRIFICGFVLSVLLTPAVVLKALQPKINYFAPDPHKEPIITIIIGDRQTGGADGYLAQAITVQVSLGGRPLRNQEVTFHATEGGAQVQAKVEGTPSSKITVKTNAAGIARSFVLLPSTPNSSCHITATFGTIFSRSEVDFTETVGDATCKSLKTAYSIYNVMSTFAADGTETMTWENNTDDPIPIWNRADSSESWKLITTVPAGTTSYVFPAK